jgi:hypothetical protein
MNLIKDPEYSPAKMTGFISKFPDLNKRLIFGTLKLVRDIASDKHFLSTRMSLSNLAIVLAPSLIRRGLSVDTEADPSLLEESKNEINFIVALLTDLAQDPGTPDFVSLSDSVADIRLDFKTATISHSEAMADLMKSMSPEPLKHEENEPKSSDLQEIKL